MNIHHNYLEQTAQQNYADLHQLQTISHQGKTDKDGALKAVAKQFESLFLQMMLKSMRQANDVFAKDNPLNSSEMSHHRDMYDKQLSLLLGESGRVGVAQAFYRQMSASYLGHSGAAEKTQALVYPKPPESATTQKQAELIDKAFAYIEKYQKKLPSIESIFESIKSPQDFINTLKPMAKKTAQRLGADYRVLIAQAALETGWGKHIIRDLQGNNSFNLFNIKAHHHWEGKATRVPTIEYRHGIANREVASFRQYDTLEQSFADYAKFISTPRYEKALANANDAKAFTQQLQNAGYATDPHYADKIQRILNGKYTW